MDPEASAEEERGYRNGICAVIQGKMSYYDTDLFVASEPLRTCMAACDKDIHYQLDSTCIHIFKYNTLI